MPPPPEPAPTPQAPNKAFGLPAALIAVAGIAAIGAFATLFSIWARTTTPGIADTLRIASEEFAAGRPSVAAKLAQQVSLPDDFEDAELIHLRDFLIGAGIADSANEAADLDSWRLAMHEAIPYLQASQQHGFPPGREAEGERLLGEALLSKGQFREAATHLAAAIDVDPSVRLRLTPMLVECQLLSNEIPGAEALQTAETLLKWQTPGSLAYFQAKLLSGRASERLQQWPTARAKFREVIDHCQDAPLVLEARLLEAASQVSEAALLQKESGSESMIAGVEAILKEAIETLLELDREADPLLATRAKLWIARAERVMNRHSAAIASATAVRQHRPFNAESIAGGILEVELLAEENRGQEVLQTVRYLVREIGDPRLFDGRIVRIEEFRQRMSLVADRLREAGLYQTVIDLARSLPPVFSADDAFMLEAVALENWGDATLEEGRGPDGEIPPAVAGTARTYFRSAGDACAAAADERFTTRRYVPTLWSAITAYEKGRDFERTLELLEKYLTYEDRPLKPRGLIAKGRALLALAQPREALEPLTDCIIEHPRDSLRYEARLIAATAHAELGDLSESQALLNENLYDGTLAPESPVWRDSLFLLGRLLYQNAYQNHLRLTGKVTPPQVQQTGTVTAETQGFPENQRLLDDAIGRLEETAARERMLVKEDRFSDDIARDDAISRAQTASYLAARSRQMAAHWPSIEANSPDILDVARRRLNQTRDEHLQRALTGFNELRETLARREETRPLSTKDEALLRNCFLAGADVLREMGKLPEAAEAYRSVSLRYMNEPPALEAMLGQARCMEDLGRRREAGLIIRQAERVLQRIPDTMDSQFIETTRYDREQWERLLNWLAPPSETAGT